MTLKTGLVSVSLVLSVLIGLLLARGVVAPTAGSGSRQAPLIGFSMDTLKEARWQHDRDVFVEKAKSLGARDVLVQSANGDDTRQVNDIASLITAGIDVLVIVPHDGAAMAKGVRMAKDAGIPVIAYDRMIQSPDLDLYISFDNVAVGRLQAKYLVEHLPTPGRGKIVRIYGSKTDNNAKLFKQGQDEVLAPLIERGDIEVVWEDWKPENAKKIVNSAISAKGKTIDAIPPGEARASHPFHSTKALAADRRAFENSGLCRSATTRSAARQRPRRRILAAVRDPRLQPARRLRVGLSRASGRGRRGTCVSRPSLKMSSRATARDRRRNPQPRYARGRSNRRQARRRFA